MKLELEWVVVFLRILSFTNAARLYTRMNRSGCCEVNTHELVTSQELTVNKVRIKVNEVIMADDVLFDTTIGGSEVLITFRSSGGAASFMIKSINVQEGRSYDGNTIMLCAEIMPSKL